MTSSTDDADPAALRRLVLLTVELTMALDGMNREWLSAIDRELFLALELLPLELRLHRRGAIPIPWMEALGFKGAALGALGLGTFPTPRP